MCFHPMCFSSTYSEFSGNSIMDKNGHFSRQPKIIIPSYGSSEMPSILVGGTLHLHLQGLGFNSRGWQTAAIGQQGWSYPPPPFFHGSP